MRILISGVLIVLLLWRLWASRRHLLSIKAKQMPALVNLDYPGQNSDFYLIEQALAGTDLARMENETIAMWAKRIDDQALIEVSKLHYKYRFDTDNFSAAEKFKLNLAVRSWLERK